MYAMQLLILLELKSDVQLCGSTEGYVHTGFKVMPLFQGSRDIKLFTYQEYCNPCRETGKMGYLACLRDESMRVFLRIGGQEDVAKEAIAVYHSRT